MQYNLGKESWSWKDTTIYTNIDCIPINRLLVHHCPVINTITSLVIYIQVFYYTSQNHGHVYHIHKTLNIKSCLELLNKRENAEVCEPLGQHNQENYIIVSEGLVLNVSDSNSSITSLINQLSLCARCKLRLHQVQQYWSIIVEATFGGDRKE